MKKCMNNISFIITNLECSACVRLSEGALKKISGAYSATIDLKSGKAELVSERKIAWNEIASALEAIGKSAHASM